MNVSLCDTRKKFKKIIKVVLVITNEGNKKKTCSNKNIS